MFQSRPGVPPSQMPCAWMRVPGWMRTVRGTSEVGWKAKLTGPAFVMQTPAARDGARLKERRPWLPTKVDLSEAAPGLPRTNG